MSNEHQAIYDHLGLDTEGGNHSEAGDLGDAVVGDVRAVAEKCYTKNPGKGVIANTNVTVVFTQEGEHVHSWEATASGIESSRMIEAACCSGLVDESLPLSFIVYNDELEDGVEEVLMERNTMKGFQMSITSMYLLVRH